MWQTPGKLQYYRAEMEPYVPGRDAELLISANQDVRKLAETGELAKIHTKFEDLQKRIDGDYLATRNNISKILI